MGLAFVPIYIKYLGIESYGLIGLFAVLTAWLSLLDMGMTPTLSREMARFTGGSSSGQSIRDLLRTIEVIIISIALVIAVGVSLGANWIATYWLRSDELSIEVVGQAFAIMGLVTALRFAESIYRSSIVGLQRQVLFNIVNSCLSTVRGLGAVCVLAWLSPSIQAFFVWQGLLSVLTLVIFAALTYASLPPIRKRARFSLQELRRVWRFAGGLLGITFLALLLTQVDKLLLSKLLSLTDFGYYTLAASVAAVLYMMITPISQAVYPRLCELQACGDQPVLADTYHKSAQLVSVLAGSPAILIIVFADVFLRLWTQDPDLAQRTAPLLSVLMIGNLLNGIMWIPYQTQLAHGWTSLTVKVNFVAVAIFVPTILFLTPRYGALGAALSWAILNLFYVLIAVQFMYRRILRGERWNWYVHDLLFPLGSSLLIALLLRLIWPPEHAMLNQLLLLSVGLLLTTTCSLLSSSRLRRHFQNTFHTLL
ncbi:lipopolysaccharide biosynthesis protein [Synechococcus sp. NB0720_010]|uniref:lipopolysaccharide biosynthesis protein n=1 Tax=Synechococcus sp. NB0720_010 TaxID=2907159 RepID=UPI001FFA7DE9|nr:oligosaccharide flippase family protein [Synechococcus sp. NB0720_010]UPH89134.1 oligosaccharide flippase family protein [Synechococcus sp. NB0720_010]